MQIATECKENSLVWKIFAKGRGKYGNVKNVFTVSHNYSYSEWTQNCGRPQKCARLKYNHLDINVLKLEIIPFAVKQSSINDVSYKENNLNKGSLKVTIH